MSNNFNQVIDLIEQMLMPDFTDSSRPIGKKLANDVLDIMSAEMLERCEDRRVDHTGTPWAPNAPSYLKKRQKQGKPVGELEHKMLTRQQFDGTRTFEPGQATMEYGITEFERKKAQWFTRGSEENLPGDIEASGATNQPPRPFFELDDDIRSKAIAEIEETQRMAIDQFNRGGII
ncbi:hypothetical protein UFOVP124_49 [uncultured Caudovirales phage]|uniref:Uncharacterized protein n=1 Tax=uncultured Caudovirales phage TaxID=2100421 RepID=A0A6J5LAH6_9CAUD|nr:hypothetical protein UFOVP124_49 [uncultured Caudovirales phage]